MKKRLLIFANPTSGRGRGMTILSQLTPALQREGWDVEARVEHPSHLDDIGDPSEIHALIVVGGDGTLRCVIERVAHLVGLENVPPVMVIGLGTANLMQRHLKLKYDDANMATQVAGMLRKYHKVKVDTAIAGDRLFLLVASCGIDAAVVHELSSVRTGPITKFSYVGPAITALKDFRFPKLTVEIDGQLVLENRSALVFVGNVAEYGTGFNILSKASSFDRRLDICIMPVSSRAEVVYMGLLTLTGKHVNTKGVLYTTGREVVISGDISPLQVDGEAAGETPVRIRLLEERIAFIVQ